MSPNVADRDDQNQRAHELVRELGRLADQLAGLGHRAALAAVRAEFAELCDAADQLRLVHDRFSELHTALLVAGRPRRPKLALVPREGNRDGD